MTNKVLARKPNRGAMAENFLDGLLEKFGSNKKRKDLNLFLRRKLNPKLNYD